jgi:hypothetical protein
MSVRDKLKILLETLNILSNEHLNNDEDTIYRLYLEELDSSTTFLHNYFLEDLLEENIINEKLMLSISNLRENILELLENDYFRDIDCILNSNEWIKIREEAKYITSQITMV